MWALLATASAACGSQVRAAPENHPLGTPSRVSGDVLGVTCSGADISVDARAVDAGPSGVRLRIARTGPTDTYLNYASDDATGGARVPSRPSVRTLGAAPGQLRLSCSADAIEGATVLVDVRDPGHHWRGISLAELGCRGSGMPSWAVGPGHGASASAAVADLAAFLGRAVDHTPVRMTATSADVGYPAAARETWIIERDGRPYATAVVSRRHGAFVADPDLLC